MKVKELIKELQKLPQESTVIADVLGDENSAEIVSVRAGAKTYKAFSFIAIDRSEEVKMHLNFISDMRSDYEGDQEEWIPVTERLPEEKGQYLVAIEDNEGCLIETTKAFYELNGLWSSPFFYMSDVVTAWMPLPEPYKEDKDDTARD